MLGIVCLLWLWCVIFLDIPFCLIPCKARFIGVFQGPLLGFNRKAALLTLVTER